TGANQVGPGRQMEEVLKAMIRSRLGQTWQEAYRRLGGVLARVLRASSCVECVNSVVRMHQARHRNLNQGLLDLKRLFWNCRAFIEGKRKRRCPYQLLGLQLPTFDPWALLHMSHDHLTEVLSS